jgi:molybdate transport system permease protein
VNWSPVLLSLRITACATVMLAVIGLLLAKLLARRTFTGKTAVEALVLLPLVLPPSVVGYYLLVALGEQNALLRQLGINLLFTWQGAVIAASVVGLPLMVQASRAAIESVNPALENAARVLGSTETEVFFRITLPLARRGVLAGLVLGAARAFGEFGATLMVAGSIPGRTQTVPLAIYDAVQAGDNGLAVRFVLLTTVLAFVSVWLVRRLEQRTTAAELRAVATP